MDVKEILKHVDHTLLTQTATWAEIRQICDDAIKYGTASVCIPPAYVKQVKEYVKDQMQVCTVIGFPNGYMTTATKEFETKDALANGADEIDMVINIGWAKDGKFDAIEEEIRTLKKACGSKILKVIIETCLLTDEEKKAMCKAVTAAGADYIKTSTGFSKAGATFEDIKLFSEHIGPNVKMKAAGGISSLDDAEKFLSLGADRLGTSPYRKDCKTGRGYRILRRKVEEDDEETGRNTDSGTDRKSNQHDGSFLFSIFSFSCRCGTTGEEWECIWRLQY